MNKIGKKRIFAEKLHFSSANRSSSRHSIRNILLFSNVCQRFISFSCEKYLHVFPWHLVLESICQTLACENAELYKNIFNMYAELCVRWRRAEDGQQRGNKCSNKEKKKETHLEKKWNRSSNHASAQNTQTKNRQCYVICVFERVLLFFFFFSFFILTIKYTRKKL